MKKFTPRCFLFAMALLANVNNSYAQKGKIADIDINMPRKPARVTFPVKIAKLQSTESMGARAEYLKLTKAGQKSNAAISSLRVKGFSNSAILSAVAQIRNAQITPGNSISNEEIADDAQLMMKSIPNITAAEMITAIRDLYDMSLVGLFDIALLAMQDSIIIVSQSKYFLLKCDCIIRNPANVNSSTPYRAGKSQNKSVYTHNKKLYPWQCYDYWNLGFRSVLLPETTLNEFLRQMRLSSYPLYGGMNTADMTDPSLNFAEILGGTAANLMDELMEMATLSYLAPGPFSCDMESPRLTLSDVNYSDDIRYSGTCKHQSHMRTRFYLKEILPVLKRNGFTILSIATAAKTRFGIPDDDMKQRILASFETTVFSATEIMQASSIINSN